jgi:hypothetical protein
MIQSYLALPEHFPITGKDVSERPNIRACHLFIFGWQTREHRPNRPDCAQDVKLESTPRDGERQKTLRPINPANGLVQLNAPAPVPVTTLRGLVNCAQKPDIRQTT